MRTHLVWLALVFVMPMVLVGCTAEVASPGSNAPSSAAMPTPSGETSVAPPTALDAPTLESIAHTRVFFAHRSVGADIVVKGLPAVFGEYGVKPPVVNDGVPLSNGSFGDRWLNQTENPQSKLQDFDMWVRQKGVGSAADIAFMKLGFVDIKAETDVPALFHSYKSMMDRLERDYPDVRFLHVTVSVTRWVPENNAAIEKYNEMMRGQYGDTGRLFDLAAVVSTCPDGKSDKHTTSKGDVYFQICKEYTTDGGHLNERGAELAATAMLGVIAAAEPGPSVRPDSSSSTTR
ncbi:MAG: hypothetical protein L0H41_14330 [Microlunatus sp.]|nr:hypothetical protein [Microlunatus sp.]